MYTYDSFVTNGTFSLLRPIPITLLIISLIVFLFIMMAKTKKFINGFAVIGIAVVASVISIQLNFYNAIIADELNLGGDDVSLIISVITIAVNGLNLIIYYNRRNAN